MAPWITLGIAAILGAAIGGVWGFLVGLTVGFAFNFAVGEFVNRSSSRAARKAGAEMLQRSGAPPPPYPLDPQDRVCARRIAAMLPGCVIKETQGILGPQLELLLPAASMNPLAVFSRTWDPEKRRVGTLLVCSGNVEAPIIQAAADSELHELNMPGPFTMFSRF